MVEFLNKDKAYGEIVEIVSKATSKVVLITPYIKVPDDLLERLKYMDGKGLRIVIICREKDLKSEVRNELKKLKNLELRFDEDLHAKCFYNEDSMVITSLNLHEHSQQHNREMGILLNSREDSNVFNEALGEAEFIVSRAKKDSVIGSIARGIAKEAKAVLDSPIKDKSSRAKTTSRTKREGHCIRCNKSIPYDKDKPYCLPCARLWNKYGGYGDHKEKYCHQCGKTISTTYNSPRCGSCYWGH
jgi:phosphatidylserine/phosphatidylglycerophosphate/cardiolipin synthase-like enzyme